MDQGARAERVGAHAGLQGQSIPAVSDIDQHYKENMDKTEAY